MSRAPAPGRRRVSMGLGLALVLPASLGLTGLMGLSGCGFKPRGAVALPFRRIALSGFGPRSTLATALRTGLSARAEVVATTAQAEVVLHNLLEVRERIVSGVSATGLVRDFTLRLRFRFRVSAPGGVELLAPLELALVRDMTTTESAALAKAAEEAEIFQALEVDVAEQTLRRLEALRVPAPANPSPDDPRRTVPARPEAPERR